MFNLNNILNWFLFNQCTTRAFKKRIKACQHHKAKGLEQEPNDPSGPNLDDKIEELENSIR